MLRGFPSIILRIHLFRGNPISGGGQTRCRHRQMPYRTLVSHGTREMEIQGLGMVLGYFWDTDGMLLRLHFWGHFAVRSSSSYRVLGSMATCWLPHFSLPLCCDNKWLGDRWAAGCRFTFKMPPNRLSSSSGPRVWSLYLAIKRESRPKSRLPRFSALDFVSCTGRSSRFVLVEDFKYFRNRKRKSISI